MEILPLLLLLIPYYYFFSSEQVCCQVVLGALVRSTLGPGFDSPWERI